MVKKSVGKVAQHAFLITMCIISLFPLYIMIIDSMKNSGNLALDSYGWPDPWTFNNYVRLWGYNSGVIIKTYFNSIFITIVHTVLVLIFSALAAFAFSKYKFKGRDIIFTFLISSMMVPFELSITPLYVIFSHLKWLNTYQIQIIPFTANVFAMFMIRQYMNTISDSLLEAAVIDGAGHWRIFQSVILPVCKPILGATAVLVALSKFNDYLWPKIMVTKPEIMPIMTIMPTLSASVEKRSVPRELILAGCMLVVIPLIVLFIFMQDVFMSSITLGAVKE